MGVQRRQRADGRRVAVVAPAGPVDPVRLRRGLDLLGSWGLDPVLGATCRRAFRGESPSGPTPYLSAPDPERLDDLVWALAGVDHDLVWLARGGYGMARLLPRVHWSEVVARPVLGFSDLSGLLGQLSARTTAVPIHAAVVHSVGYLDDASTSAHRTLLRRLTSGGAATVEPECWRGVARVPGEASGHLVGGNLSTLAALAGSPYALRSEGAILLLEDVGEAPHRLDRALLTLQQAGCLDGVRGIGFGWLSARPWAAEEPGPRERAVLHAVGELGVPVLTRLPFGHGPVQRPFTLGAPARIEGDVLHVG